MTTFEFGEVILVPFPFTDHSATKQRPAVVISSSAHQRDRLDLIIMAVTSQSRSRGSAGEAAIVHWQDAGLLKPSLLKPLIATVEKRLVRRKLGRLHQDDLRALRDVLQTILG